MFKKNYQNSDPITFIRSNYQLIMHNFYIQWWNDREQRTHTKKKRFKNSTAKYSARARTLRLHIWSDVLVFVVVVVVVPQSIWWIRVQRKIYMIQQINKLTRIFLMKSHFCATIAIAIWFDGPHSFWENSEWALHFTQRFFPF